MAYKMMLGNASSEGDEKVAQRSHTRSADAGFEHLDVLVVGAGLSGIDAACRLQTGSPDRRFAIFEARDAIGGTWDLFRYPGVRSDTDMSTLGFPFRPWRDDRAIAEGGEIRDYVRETARSCGVDRLVRLRHRVISADWSEAEARWTVEYEAEGQCRRLTCGFLFMCAGYYDYSEGHAPRWPGTSDFVGRMIHPQFWPDEIDLRKKRVVVIGSGATAVTLVPALVREGAGHVTMLQRSPTYILSVPSEDRLAIRWRKLLPSGFADTLIRWKNIALGIFFYNLARRRPAAFKRMLARSQGRILGPELVTAHLTPRYEPWDQRLCLVPDNDLFKVLKSGEASIVTDTIERFTPGGLQLTSGATLPADIIVTATGLKIRVMGGIHLTLDGAPVEVASRMLYRGAMLEAVPNFALAVGYTNASWTLRCDLSARFVSRLLNHMARRGLASARPEAAPGMRGEAPMLDLRSGYIERAAAMLPRQGLKPPWRVRQNYVRDMLGFGTSRMNDGVLRFEKAGNKGQTAT